MHTRAGVHESVHAQDPGIDDFLTLPSVDGSTIPDMLRGFTVAAAVALLVAGCGGSTETYKGPPIAATSATAPTETMSEFIDELDPIMDKLGKDFRWMGGAAESLDMADLRAACRDFDTAVTDLENALPGPDTLVNTSLREAVRDWRKMGDMCQGASPRMSSDEIEQMGSLRDSGMDHFGSAVDLIKKAQQSGE